MGMPTPIRRNPIRTLPEAVRKSVASYVCPFLYFHADVQLQLQCYDGVFSKQVGAVGG